MAKLKTTVLRRSKGIEISKGDNLLVWYEGTLVDSGERFDANYDFTTFAVPTGTPSYAQLDGSFVLQATPSSPFEFVVGSGTVLPGWEQTFEKGRRLGEVIEVTIPADLAYGEAGSNNVPPNSDLNFKIEIIGVLQEGAEVPNFPQLKDLGINAKKLGLKSEALNNLNSTKIGLDGDDRLIGDNTKDLLIGLGGSDRLFGAGGADVLIGGKGSRYVYTDLSDSPSTRGERDTIYGFSKKDKINLRALVEEARFIGSDKFSGTAGDVRFKNETLELDQDGDGSADFAIAMPGTKALKGSNLML